LNSEILNKNRDASDCFKHSGISQTRQFEIGSGLQDSHNGKLFSSISEYTNSVAKSMKFLLKTSQATSISRDSFCKILHDILKTSNDLRMNLSMIDERMFQNLQCVAMKSLFNTSSDRAPINNSQSIIPDVNFRTFMSQSFEPQLLIPSANDHLEPFMAMESLKSSHNFDIESPMNYSHLENQPTYDGRNGYQYPIQEREDNDPKIEPNPQGNEFRSLNFTPLKELYRRPIIPPASNDQLGLLNSMSQSPEIPRLH
jgi:hypothetical protein